MAEHRLAVRSEARDPDARRSASGMNSKTAAQRAACMTEGGTAQPKAQRRDGVLVLGRNTIGAKE
jgi:hypothetical protein